MGWMQGGNKNYTPSGDGRLERYNKIRTVYNSVVLLPLAKLEN